MKIIDTVTKLAGNTIAVSVIAARFGIFDVNWRAWKRVAVYPRLGLAYNRIKKNANTTVVMLLREMETGFVETRKVAKDNSPKIRDLSFQEILGVRKSCFFVVVRNPYSRVLSAFLNRFTAASSRQHGHFELNPHGFAAFVEWLKDVQPERGGVEQGAVTFDDAGILQPLDAPQARRRRDADPVGQLDIGDAPLPLQLAQDLPVDGV